MYCVVSDRTPVMVKAHLFMLCGASQYFMTQFSGKFKQYDVLDIPDMEPEAFKEVLR